MSASSKIAWCSTRVARRKRLQIAWRGTRAVRHQAPLMLLFLQVSPGGTTLIAKRHMLQFSTGFVAITWRSNTTARCYASTRAVLVFKHPELSKINPFTFHIYIYIYIYIYSPFKIHASIQF